MDMEIIKALLLFAGGLGMFLYGMETMAEGLQQAAGEKTRKLLGVLTNNPLMGLGAGALVTAVIQSSSAATVMVVGFVNAGLMSLKQACYIIMGANIGTTMTAWIVSMGEWAAFLKPEMIAPALLMVGVILQMSSRNSRRKQAAKILIGFGILFTGLSSMSGAIKPFTDAPVFKDIFVILGSNPILAVLAGTLVTAIIQSSSASLGILQTLATAGAVNWGSAVFIALGQNIGTCVTAMISAVSGDINAKRAAAIHLEFNVIGALLAGTVLWLIFLANPALSMMPVSATSLAIFHTGFNVIITAVLFPFGKQLVELSKILVPSKTKQKKNEENYLEPRLQMIPSAALNAVDEVIMKMSAECKKLIEQAEDCLCTNASASTLEEPVSKIQKQCRALRKYLLELEKEPLTDAEQRRLQRSLLSARDIYQIAARTVQISRIREEHEGHSFHQPEKETIHTLGTLCKDALEVIAQKDQYSRKQRRKKIAGYIRESLQVAERNRKEEMDGSFPHQDTEEVWMLAEASEGFESILRRCLRLANEDEWHIVPGTEFAQSVSK